MDTHGAVATALLQDQGLTVGNAATLVDEIKRGNCKRLSEKMQALLDVALAVRDHGRTLVPVHVSRATASGATDEDLQLAVLIASAFSMFNRIVDGYRARTPSDIGVHGERARQIVQSGYAKPPPTVVPAVA